MSRLDSAFERFNQAIDRVEGALRQAPPKGHGGAKASDGAMAALKAERDRLAQQLDQAHRDYGSLETLTDEVETRLDTAIANIQKMMRG
jgi:Domain of unknown function (DUF4164)